ncbi:MAG: glycosyltransferase family 2 protein [Nitrososphaeria archaeon]
MKELSIIIPTYNERENIGRLIEMIIESLNGIDFEIIVVDDNSPDGTGEFVEQLSNELANLKVIHRPGKLGLSSAILDGASIAQGYAIGVIDADLQHPPQILKEMFSKILEGYDVVVASRYIKGGGIEGWSFTRKIISKTASFLAHLLLKRCRTVSDPLSGYFMFRKDVIDGVKFEAKGYKILLEVLEKGRYNKVAEVPYIFRSRKAGESKMKFNEILNYVKLLMKLSEYRVLKFVSVGLSGVVVNLGSLWLLVNLFNFPELYSAIFSIELSIINNFILNDFWTFKDRRSSNFFYRLIKFHGSALGPLINYIVYVFLLLFGVNYLVADAIGIVCGFVANYLFSEFIVWR